MNDLTKISKAAIINITKSKGMYVVTIQPYNQVKREFQHKKIKDAYKQVITFLLGYLFGYTEHYTLSIDELYKVISFMNEIFSIDIDLLVN